VEPIDPRFDAYRDVRILLQTRENRLNPQQLAFRNLNSIQQSHFNRNRPTRVLVHGWWEDDESDIGVDTSAELLNYNDFNVRVKCGKSFWLIVNIFPDSFYRLVGRLENN
jgi:hypothetical protein